MSMEYAIDIQCLRDRKGNLLPKEVGIASLDGNVIDHWIISPPSPFETLPEDIKITNDYVSSRLLGIQWFDGFMELNELYYNLQRVASKALRIYVRGKEACKFLQTVMSRTIVDVEEYTNVGYTELQEKLKCKTLCQFHACLGDEYKNNYCALRRAFVLRDWIRSLVSDVPENSSKDRFFESLKKLSHSERATTVRFHIGDLPEGRDVTDSEVTSVDTAESELSQDEY